MTERIATALRDYRHAEYPWRDDDPEPGDVVEGDVLVVSGMDGRGPNRMAVVLDIEREKRCFLGAFFTNEHPLATAEDVDLTPDLAGLPYPIAGLAGLTGWMWYAQIQRRIGVLTDEALNAVSAGHCGVHDEFQAAHRGMPLQERSRDLRWPTLETEGADLREFSQDCREKRHFNDIKLPYVDPRLLPAPGDSPNGFDSHTLDILEKATREDRTRGFSPSCLQSVVGTLDHKFLRAYPALFQPSGSITPYPPARGDRDDLRDWLLELTKADGLAGAGFVKMIGESEPSGHSRFKDNGRCYEFLYETVEEGVAT